MQQNILRDKKWVPFKNLEDVSRRIDWEHTTLQISFLKKV